MLNRSFRGYLLDLIRVILICHFVLFVGLRANSQPPKKERINILYSNGKTKEKGKKKHGLKQGTWLIYNQEGWLEQRIKYKNNIAIWQVYYDSKQRKVKMIDKNGQEVPYKGCNCKN